MMPVTIDAVAVVTSSATRARLTTLTIEVARGRLRIEGEVTGDSARRTRASTLGAVIGLPSDTRWPRHGVARCGPVMRGVRS